MATYSTLSEARAAYLANADYADGGGGVAKARAFRMACRSLLVLLPESAAAGGASQTMIVQSIRRELERVDAWLATHDATAASSARVIYGDVQDFRA